ncbi:MAG: hypothetical protein AABN95_09615 [Acidobacteriota bacterium]
MLTQIEFDQLMQSLTLALSQRNLEQALIEKDRVLAEGAPEMKGQCLLFVGMIRESSGDLQSAQKEWLDALSYAGEGTFLRYSLEQNIGRSWEKLGDIDQSLVWYRHALRTCAEGTEFSGQGVLSTFLKLNRETIPKEDETVVKAVISKSWRVLQLPGSPGHTNLVQSIRTLSDSFSATVKKIKNGA